jgi:hypothetical protein
MAREGFVPVLKKSRWLLLKSEENLKTQQRFRLVTVQVLQKSRRGNL